MISTQSAAAATRIISSYTDDPKNLQEITACVLCAEKDRKFLFRDGPFGVYRCASCELVYISPRLTPQALLRLHEEGCWNSPIPRVHGYADYRGDAPLYLKTFRKRSKLVQRYFDTPLRLLDIGCAAGYFMAVMRDLGWKVEGVEPSSTIVQFARARFGLDQIVQGTLEAAPWPTRSFDLVTMWDVVEHVPDPVSLLKKAASLLRDEGHLIIETQNIGSCFARLLGKRWHHFKHLEHIYHFSPASMLRLLDEANLEPVTVTPRFGGKYVSVGFIRERATRVHPVMRYLLSPLAPVDRCSLYVNVWDEMIVVARKA